MINFIEKHQRSKILPDEIYPEARKRNDRDLIIDWEVELPINVRRNRQNRYNRRSKKIWKDYNRNRDRKRDAFLIRRKGRLYLLKEQVRKKFSKNFPLPENNITKIQNIIFYF